MVSVMKLEKAPTESYADIGGLEQQIQEIKVRTSGANKRASLETNNCTYDHVGSGGITLDTSRTLRRNGDQAS
jgi:hypothetical protein